MDLPRDACREPTGPALMVKITGQKKHSARLGRMSRETKDEVYRALFVGANLITTEAQISITAGAVSGKGHVASAPGEPPNADTGALDSQIESRGDRRAMKTFSESKAPHAVPLEIGTSRMAARPSMGPAARKKRGAVVELVRQAVSRTVRKGA